MFVFGTLAIFEIDIIGGICVSNDILLFWAIYSNVCYQHAFSVDIQQSPSKNDSSTPSSSTEIVKFIAHVVKILEFVNYIYAHIKMF